MVKDDFGLFSGNRTIAHQTSDSRNIAVSLTNDQAERMLGMKSFRFRHNLGNSPLLSLSAIRDITKSLLDQRRFDQVNFNSGLPGACAKRADADTGGEILEALQFYETRRAWLRLTRVDEITSEFKDIVEQFYEEISGLYKRDIKRNVVKTFVTLFVSSPHAVTPYHIDHTWNFLLQLCGQKTVHLFDPDDPQVLTHKEREDYYTQRAEVAQRLDTAGIPYDLGPGDGVHHPVNAPHWVQNGSEVSISLSLGLCLRQSTKDAKVYQLNYLLRRLGLKPKPPRCSAWRDALKSTCIGLLSDRSPNSFNDVLYSGIDRLQRCLNLVRGLRSAQKTREIT